MFRFQLNMTAAEGLRVTTLGVILNPSAIVILNEVKNLAFIASRVNSVKNLVLLGSFSKGSR